jgi:hypothetical protein
MACRACRGAMSSDAALQPCAAKDSIRPRTADPASPIQPAPLEVVPASGARVFMLDGYVCLEISDFGRLEMPPEVAEATARALLEGAKRVREGERKGFGAL